MLKLPGARNAPADFENWLIAAAALPDVAARPTPAAAPV